MPHSDMVVHVASVNAKVVVVAGDGVVSQELEALGGRESVLGWEVPFSSRHELARVLSRLQAMGICFGSAPAGWPPSAVFEQLRDEGLVSGTIRTVTWRSPSEPVYGEA